MQTEAVVEQVMYIHFNLLCNGKTQISVHKLLRKSISEWMEQRDVKRAVLTYHFNDPPTPDSLYVCLGIPAAETVEQIPSRIMEYLDKICNEHNVRLNTTDFRLEIEQAKKNEEQKGAIYYDNAPVEEILRFASVGTSVAFEVLEQLEEDMIRNDEQLSRFILLRLAKDLGSNYEWIELAVHFVCNPLLIPRDMENSIIFGREGYTAVEMIKAIQRSAT